MIPAKLVGVVLVFSFIFSLSHSCTFTIVNDCPYTIWPGTLAGAGTPQLPQTGFRLDPGKSVSLPATPGWSGRIWARTECFFNESGEGMCQTGDCGGNLECMGAGAAPPATLFEITLGTGAVDDYYDVSIVDGYNLPMIVVPCGIFENCNVTGCTANLNAGCPKELQVVGDGNVVACKSACDAFGGAQYCCSGEFANPTTCGPSLYSTIFKTACPRAYSYAFDDRSSTFTCKAFDYIITFCPTLNGLIRSNGLSSGQPNHGNNKGDVTDMPSSSSSSSSSNLLFFHFSFLLFILHVSTRNHL